MKRGAIVPIDDLGPTASKLRAREHLDQTREPNAVEHTVVVSIDNPSGVNVPPRVIKSTVPDIRPWLNMDKTLSAMGAAVWEELLVTAVKEKTPTEALNMFTGRPS